MIIPIINMIRGANIFHRRKCFILFCLSCDFMVYKGDMLRKNKRNEQNKK